VSVDCNPLVEETGLAVRADQAHPTSDGMENFSGAYLNLEEPRTAHSLGPAATYSRVAPIVPIERRTRNLGQSLTKLGAKMRRAHCLPHVVLTLHEAQQHQAVYHLYSSGSETTTLDIASNARSRAYGTRRCSLGLR
jgi:hypothetical protein